MAKPIPVNMAKLPTNTRKVAVNTISRIPAILKIRPDAKPAAKLYEDVSELDSDFCPQIRDCSVQVLDIDSFDAAELLGQAVVGADETDAKPVLVLNFANATKPGGGFLTGAIAQEEDLCRRSTLYECLLRHKFPIPEHAMLYHPGVVVFGDTEYKDLPGGVRKWPLVSVISAAPIINPTLMRRKGRSVYAVAEERAIQEDLCRTIIRVAALEGHRNLVLGAIGCGSFGHPNEEAAQIWADILTDSEFDGWFEEIWFAVMSKGDPVKGKASYNFTAFSEALQGLVVGRGERMILGENSHSGSGMKYPESAERGADTIRTKKIPRRSASATRASPKKQARLQPEVIVDGDRSQVGYSTNRRRSKSKEMPLTRAPEKEQLESISNIRTQNRSRPRDKWTTGAPEEPQPAPANKPRTRGGSKPREKTPSPDTGLANNLRSRSRSRIREKLTMNGANRLRSLSRGGGSSPSTIRKRSTVVVIEKRTRLYKFVLYILLTFTFYFLMRLGETIYLWLEKIWQDRQMGRQ